MDSLIGIMKDFFSHFSQWSYLIPPEIIKITFGFLMFSGNIKREHWEETGQAF